MTSSNQKARRLHADRWALLVGVVLCLQGCAEGAISSPDGDDSDDWTGGDQTGQDTEPPPGCPSGSCAPATSMCAGPYSITTCIDDGSGCGTFSEPVACGLSEVCEAGDCVPFALCNDGDGDTYGEGCSAGPDCDDTDSAVNPGAVEACDGVDNNCTAGIDEGCAEACAGQPCNVGERRCNGGGDVEECVADASGCGSWGTPAACAGTCTDGVCAGCTDGDGDGRGAGCPLGDDCDDNDAARYAGQAESCDGVDNDCDDAIDEDFATKGQSCSVGQGACQRDGTNVCRTDGAGVRCDATAASPSAEQCGDSVDSDCDGNNDNGFESIGQSCTSGTGSCASAGTLQCRTSDPTQTTCNAPAPTGTPETCDGQDNDCDGQSDEGGVCTSCTDDSKENNDTSLTGTDLTSNKTISGLMSCGTDVDWFFLGNYASATTMNFELTHPTGNNGVGAPWANLNVEFYCGIYCKGIYGTETTGNFSGSGCCGAGDRMTLRVYPHQNVQPASGTPYSIRRY